MPRLQKKFLKERDEIQGKMKPEQIAAAQQRYQELLRLVNPTAVVVEDEPGSISEKKMAAIDASAEAGKNHKTTRSDPLMHPHGARAPDGVDSQWYYEQGQKNWSQQQAVAAARAAEAQIQAVQQQIEDLKRKINR